MGLERNRWIRWAGVTALLLLHVVLALRAVSGKSITVDEIFHLTGGYLFNRYSDFRIHPDNGVLPQRWHALPAWLGDAKPPALSGNEAWLTSDVYALSHQFFYESGNDHWPMLMQARMMNLAWSVGAGLLVFFWARKLAGDLAGFIALTLLALSPTFLAHGPLASSDMCAALLLPCSAGAFWWQLRRRRPGPMLISAAVFGLACISKYSAVLLLPTFLVLAGAHLLIAPPVDRDWRRAAGSLLVHGIAAWAIIWAAFGFRFSVFGPELPASAGNFNWHWDKMLAHAGWQAGTINFIRTWHLLPEGFLFGYTNTYVGAQARSAFLAGEYSSTGWIRFFPLTFLWKSTGAELTGMVLAVISAGWYWRKLGPWLRVLAPLLVWSAVYGTIALHSHLNIGHRHLLPLYPGLFIVAGVAAALLVGRWRYAMAAVLVGLQALATAGIHPHYLAYFNALAGGPANGHRLLVDSSLDWGQDLPGLRDWLEANNPRGVNRERVYLSYFGSGKPEYYHLEATHLPFVDGFKFIHPYYDPAGGIYCVSATTLQEVYSPLRGDFTPALEREYQSLRPFTPTFRAYWQSPEARMTALQSTTEENLIRAWLRFDLLRFSRLCHYLRARSPDAMIGYSILVYRLTDEEIDRVLHRDYGDWVAAVNEAGHTR